MYAIHMKMRFEIQAVIAQLPTLTVIDRFTDQCDYTLSNDSAELAAELILKLFVFRRRRLSVEIKSLSSVPSATVWETMPTVDSTFSLGSKFGTRMGFGSSRKLVS